MINYLTNQSERLLKLSSAPQNISRLQGFVERIARQYSISSDTYGNILISLTEAVNNAIRHGNGNDESKMVEVRLQEYNGELSIKVRDEGNGFDYKKLPNPTAPENITEIGGRGVYLMQQLADGVSFQDNGSTVEMRFSINDHRL